MKLGRRYSTLSTVVKRPRGSSVADSQYRKLRTLILRAAESSIERPRARAPNNQVSEL
jgi:hypothetical protein